MKVIGIERNYESKFKAKDGRDVELKGVRLYLGFERKDVEGMAHGAKPLYVGENRDSYDLAKSLKVGDEIKCYYNEFGTFESLELVSIDK